MADRRLQVFHAVAKQMSFTRAAEVLFMTQPAVTFQIKQLEEHYNTRLFERGHGRIALTPAGELVLEYAERILAQSSELETRLKEMTGRVAGPLLVGASMTIAEFLLPRVLGAFRQQFPEVRPQLSVGNSEAIEARVAEHAIDIGLIEAPSHLPALATESCGEDELRVVVSPRHPLAARRAVKPLELTAHAFVSREPGSGTREFTDLYLRKQGVAPESLKTEMELGSPEALKGVVASGMGFAVMSRASVVKEVRLGELVALPLDPPLMRTLSMVYPREKFRSRVVSTFVEFARSRLAEAAAESLDHPALQPAPGASGAITAAPSRAVKDRRA